MANTKSNKKNIKKKSSNDEITNGAFILLLVITVLIAGVVGWVLGTTAANLFA